MQTNIQPGALQDTFNAWIAGPGGTVEEVEEIPDNVEGIFTEHGLMRFPGIAPISCSVYYAVTGNGGKGYMLINPQDATITQNNSDAGTALINFLGGVTVDQFTNNGNVVQNDEIAFERFIIQTIAAVSFRIDYDFAAGTTIVRAIMTATFAVPGEEPDTITQFVQKVDMLEVGPEAFFARPA